MTVATADETLWIDRIRSAVLSALPSRHANGEIAAFYRLLRAYPERSGKTLRGLLVLLSTGAHGGEMARGLRCAAGIELFQNWVLVHDDIEDASEERRGHPALHLQAGMPIALNVGDAMHVYMWQLLLSHRESEYPLRDAILDEFLHTIHRTAEGQHLDLSWIRDDRYDIGEADYLEMVRLKTAYYTVIAPLRLGGLCAGVTPTAGIEAAALDLGVAFQIRDDVLNLLPNADYGKEFAGDLYEGKRTLILAHLFKHADRAERSEAAALLAAPRSSKRSEDIDRLLDLIEAHGSLAYAQRIADEHARRGLAAIEAWARTLPDAAAAARLVQLLTTVANRSR